MFECTSETPYFPLKMISISETGILALLKAQIGYEHDYQQDKAQSVGRGMYRFERFQGRI